MKYVNLKGISIFYTSAIGTGISDIFTGPVKIEPPSSIKRYYPEGPISKKILHKTTKCSGP